MLAPPRVKLGGQLAAGALSAVMLSNSCLRVRRRYANSPSALHAVGWLSSKPLRAQRGGSRHSVDGHRAALRGRDSAMSAIVVV